MTREGSAPHKHHRACGLRHLGQGSLVWGIEGARPKSWSSVWLTYLGYPFAPSPLPHTPVVAKCIFRPSFAFHAPFPWTPIVDLLAWPFHSPWRRREESSSGFFPLSPERRAGVSKRGGAKADRTNGGLWIVILRLVYIKQLFYWFMPVGPSNCSAPRRSVKRVPEMKVAGTLPMM